jgi:hypothetical protein
MARPLEKYPYLDDIDYVKINVKGDGSCFYRAMYTAAANYPITDPEIAQNLMDEFIGMGNLLTVVLSAFHIPAILPEDEAVRAIRNKIALGVTNASDNAEFNATCRAHYLAVLNTLREAYSSEDRGLYNEIIDAASQEFKKIFSTSQNIRSHVLGDGVKAREYLAEYQAAYDAKYALLLNNINEGLVDEEGIQIVLERDNGYKQSVIAALQTNPDEYFFNKIAEIITKLTTYASESDITLIQTLLGQRNIIIKTTSLETINKNQIFPIIQDRKPFLLVDRVGAIHYQALIPFEVYTAKVANAASPLPAKVATYGRPAKPIKYSRCTYKKRKQRGLRGGSRRLKRKQRK